MPRTPSQSPSRRSGLGPARLAAPLLAVLAGCGLGDFYSPDRQYVLYDPSVPPTRDTEAGADPVDEFGGLEPDATEAAFDELEAAGGVDPGVARIFTLEAARDELQRAVEAGVGDAAALQVKIDDLDTEITWRKTEAGPAYERLRTVRLARLRAMPVEVR